MSECNDPNVKRNLPCTRRPHIVLLILITTCAFAAGLALSEPDAMSVAAQALIDSLDEEQRAACVYPFEDAELRNWQADTAGAGGGTV